MLTDEDLAALFAFVRARLHEDEQAARLTVGEKWQLVEDAVEPDSDDYERRGTLRAEDGSSLVDNHVESKIGLLFEDLAHIARHDPARVLREVRAKRARVALVEGSFKPPPSVGDYMLEAGAAIGARLLAVAMLRAEAEPYADHPAYQELWRP